MTPGGNLAIEGSGNLANTGCHSGNRNDHPQVITQQSLSLSRNYHSCSRRQKPSQTVTSFADSFSEGTQDDRPEANPHPHQGQAATCAQVPRVRPAHRSEQHGPMLDLRFRRLAEVSNRAALSLQSCCTVHYRPDARMPPNAIGSPLERPKPPSRPRCLARRRRPGASVGPSYALMTRDISRPSRLIERVHACLGPSGRFDDARHFPPLAHPTFTPVFPSSMTIHWANQPLVVETRSACPWCHSVRRPTIVRTADNGDGSQTRNCICRHCSRPFKVAVEISLPVSGNRESGPT